MRARAAWAASRQSWLRQAGALLISFIALIAYPHAAASKKLPFMEQSELCGSVMMAKHVIINDFAKEIDCCLFVGQCCHIHFRQDSFHAGTNLKTVIPRVDYPQTWYFYRIRKFYGFRLWKQLYFVGRRLSEVANRGSYNWLLSLRNVGDCNDAFQPDVCAQLPFGSIFHYVNSLAQSTRLDNESDKLQKANANERQGRPNRPPIGRFFLMALGVISGSVLGLWLGPNYFNDERRLLGSAIIVGGFFLVAFGLGLCLSVGFRGTWGWPL
jgi:hypothetical protein